MKKTAWMIGFCLPLFLAAGCAREPVLSDTTAATIGTSVVTVPEMTTMPPTEPSSLVLPDSFEVFGSPEEIYVFPYLEVDLLQAKETAAKTAELFASEPGVKTFYRECLEFDPILTDIQVRQQIAEKQIPGWTEEEYYRHFISFTLVYSAIYDHSLTFIPDASHQAVGIHLFRQSMEDAWSVRSTGVSVSNYSQLLIEPILPETVEPLEERILAVYGPVGDEYWVYQESGETEAVYLHKYAVSVTPPVQSEQPTSPIETAPVEHTQPESTDAPVLRESVFQTGNPISPQPGDTTPTWNPGKADAYPEDFDCTPEQFFEKWLDVEGLTLQDLMDRGCGQLVIVSAQKSDGVETLSTCYEQDPDGSWNAVDGLIQMTGHTGSNGICHERKRNTNTSPAGLWKLGTAFGNAAEPDGLQIPWRQITPQSDWVCDADSIYFNTWQERDDPTLSEEWNYGDVEHLEDYPKAYAYACVIEFNTAPYTIPDRGCAIFFHCSRGATDGCIGLSQSNMVQVLRWMDADRNPFILITGEQRQCSE